MKIWIVEKRETEITSYKEACQCYEGITLDPDANGGNTDPAESYEFDTREKAMAFLNRQANNYFYNGSGYGYAEEWTCHEEDTEASIETVDYDSTPHSNFSEFEQELNKEPENDY